MLANLVMLAWLPFVMALFLLTTPKRAVLWSFFLAWLFLPMAKYDFPNIPTYTKMTATSFGVLLGVLLFDPGRLMTFKPRWIDLPLVLFATVAPVMTTLTNSPPMTPRDAISEALALGTVWLMPYFIGRLYFTTLKDMQVLALCFVAGALAYVPICWFEARMSPQLHRWVYGFHAHHFVHAVRGGFFRPRGFMQTGLMTGMWMCAAALIAWCLWIARTPFRLGGYQVQPWWVVAILGVTALICNSLGALVLAFGGFCVLLATRLGGTRAFMIMLLCVAPVFIAVRSQNFWTGEGLISFVQSISADRAQSLEYRFDNDTQLADKAMRKPLFGWGGYGRNLVRDEWGNRTATDGMWIILFGKMGFVGLIPFFLALVMPALLFMKRYPPRVWFTPSIAPVTVLVTVLVLYQVDCLLNAMENPMFILFAGGLCSMLTSAAPAARRVARPVPVRDEPRGDTTNGRRPEPAAPLTAGTATGSRLTP